MNGCVSELERNRDFRGKINTHSTHDEMKISLVVDYVLIAIFGVGDCVSPIPT